MPGDGGDAGQEMSILGGGCVSPQVQTSIIVRRPRLVFLISCGWGARHKQHTHGPFAESYPELTCGMCAKLSHTVCGEFEEPLLTHDAQLRAAKGERSLRRRPRPGNLCTNLKQRSPCTHIPGRASLNSRCRSRGVDTVACLRRHRTHAQGEATVRTPREKHEGIEGVPPPGCAHGDFSRGTRPRRNHRAHTTGGTSPIQRCPSSASRGVHTVACLTCHRAQAPGEATVCTTRERHR
jgi:hypothetical protein